MPSKSASKWLETGRAALQSGAWEKARAAFDRGLAIEESPEGLEGSGWARYWLGANEESLDLRERAYRAYLDRSDRENAARVAIGLAAGSYDVRGPAAASGWVELSRRHLQRLPASALHGWLALYEGHVARLVADDSKKARTLARRAARIAGRFQEPQLELLSSALEGLALVNEGRVSEGMRRVDEATTAALAGEMRDLDAVAQTCCMLLYACERVRDYKRAAEWQRRISRFSRRWGLEPLFGVCSTQHAAMLTGCGDWLEAEAQLERAVASLESSRPYLLADAIVHLAELRRRQGRYPEALALARRAATRTEAMLTQAAIALDSGDPEAAMDLAERVLGRNRGEKWVERAAALHVLMRSALDTGDHARAGRAYGMLQSIAGDVDAPAIAAIERQASGDLASAAGALEDARAAYVESLTAFQEEQAPFEAACVRLALARVLLSMGRSTAAAQEIEAATIAFETLGATGELEKARAARVQTSVTAHPLSRREREILQLIAQGLGDKQLAARLSLSEHTVHRHVANILRKLGAGSRSAAVAQALRSGWL